MLITNGINLIDVPLFRFYNNCVHQNLNLSNNNEPLRLIKPLCDDFQICVDSTLNMFDRSMRFNYIGIDPPIILPQSINKPACEKSCNARQNCKMYKYADKKCFMYNFSYSENNKKFQAVRKGQKLNTYFKTKHYIDKHNNPTMKFYSADDDDASYANRIEIGNTLSFLSIFFVLLNSFN